MSSHDYNLRSRASPPTPPMSGRVSPASLAAFQGPQAPPPIESGFPRTSSMSSETQTTCSIPPNIDTNRVFPPPNRHAFPSGIQAPSGRVQQPSSTISSTRHQALSRPAPSTDGSTHLGSTGPSQQAPTPGLRRLTPLRYPPLLLSSRGSQTTQGQQGQARQATSQASEEPVPSHHHAGAGNPLPTSRHHLRSADRPSGHPYMSPQAQQGWHLPRPRAGVPPQQRRRSTSHSQVPSTSPPSPPPQQGRQSRRAPRRLPTLHPPPLPGRLFSRPP